MTNKPYREWTLKSHYSYDYDDFKWCLDGPLVHKKSSAMPEEIVVIEHAALTDLKRENEKLRAALEKIENECACPTPEKCYDYAVEALAEVSEGK